MRKFLAAFVCILLLSACSMPYKKAVFASNGGDVTFGGVVDNLDGKEPLDVLFVHGMCTHNADWAQGAVQNVYKALGGTDTVNLLPEAVEGTDIVIFRQELGLSAGKMRAKAILWSPLTTPLKRQLCYDQTNKSAICTGEAANANYPYERASLNRLLKDTILDDCLSDAIIYQGKARNEINRQMQTAILKALSTPATPGTKRAFAASAAAVPSSLPLVIVSESLGSKVVFDAMLKLVEGPEADEATAAAGIRTIERTTQIFMGANQLPILALGDRLLDGTVAFARQEASYPEDPIAALIQAASAKRSAPGVLETKSFKIPQVVAFTDPNDSLSFILAPSPHAKDAKYPVVDVITSNGNTYLGFVELPTTAHLGYRDNETVRKLMACGNPVSARCQ